MEMALSRRSTVFIRELPLPSVEAIEEKLRQSDVPPVLSCEAAGPASWYLNFDSEETAQKAMAVLIQDGPKIFGQSIMARIKERVATQQRQPQQKRPEQPMPTLRSNPPVVINGSMAGFLPGLRLQPVMLPLPRPAYSYYEKTLALHGISAPLANSYNPFSFVMRAPASRQQTDLTSSRSPNAQGHPQSIESRSNRGGRRVTAGTNHQDSGRKPQGQRRANGSVGGRPRKSSTPAKSFDLQSTAFPPLSTTSLENSAGEKAEIPPACWNGKSSSAASATSSTKRLSSDMDQNLSFLEVQMEKMNTSGEAEEIVKKASVPEPTAKMSYAKITQKTVAAPTECGKHRE